MVIDGMPISESPHYLTLDGWRALAIMMVVACHGNVPYFTWGGARGVQLFFGLSGILICSILFREKHRFGRLDLTRFYLRRAFRILPAAFFYLGVIAVCSAVGILRSRPSEFVACVLFYRNYFASLGFSAAASWYTQHFWSLSVEEQFYFATPLLILLLRRRHLVILLPSLAITVAAWRAIDAHFSVSHHLISSLAFDTGRTDLCIDYLLWGCFAALLNDLAPEQPILRSILRDSRIQAAAFVLVSATFVFAIPGGETIFAVAMPALMLCTVHNSGTLLGRALSVKSLGWIGKLSYSLYLWQQLFLLHGTQTFASAHWLAAIQQSPSRFIIALVCAMISFYLIENPIRLLGYRLIDKIAKKQVSKRFAKEATIRASQI